jgi:hypothetical protein
MVMVAPIPENVQRLAALLAEGTLCIPVQATYELAQGSEALGALTGQHDSALACASEMKALQIDDSDDERLPWKIPPIRAGPGPLGAISGGHFASARDSPIAVWDRRDVVPLRRPAQRRVGADDWSR